MNSGDFTDAATGRLVPILGGRSDAQVAFVPDALPPQWRWPERLWPLLLEARTKLASLDGTGKHLPKPEILLRPLQQREAQLSSQLEGTITDPQQQLLFQVEPTYPTSAHDPANAHREVYNYARALRLRLDGAIDLPLSLRLIRELHATLMDGVRGSDQRPGEFRTTQNQIGRPARFVPPPPHHLAEALDAFEKYLHADHGYDPLVSAFLAHYQFEAIHPFSDGNGRVGRLLLSLTIAEWCELSSQWLYMSAYFERNKNEYMDRMLRASTHGEWEAWIEFCLKGVVAQAIDTEKRCDRLLALHREFHSRLTSLRGGSVRLVRLVDNLFETPVVYVRKARDQMNVSYPTARADFRALESLEIVKEVQNSPNVAYYCPQIYDVIYEDLA